jgi:hypothetical protein
VPADVFERLRFDETVCDDWHLYAVDYCLSVRRLGLFAYAVPGLTLHRSGGQVSAGYFRTLEKVVEKHRDSFDRIVTTCDVWTTRGPRFWNRLNYRIRRFYRDCKGRALGAMKLIGGRAAPL